MPTPMGPIDPSKVFNYKKKELFERNVLQNFVPEQKIINEKDLTRILLENDNDVSFYPPNLDSDFYSRSLLFDFTVSTITVVR